MFSSRVDEGLTRRLHSNRRLKQRRVRC